MANSDTEILEAIRAGKNSKALTYLYSDVLPKVKKYICTNSGNEEDANDIFQDAVVILFKQVKLNKFNQNYEVAGFIYSICRNLWINKAKKEKRKVNIDDQQDIMEPGDFLEDMISDEREQLINEAFKKLGKKCKELLINIIYNDMPVKEVKAKMGFKNENAVKTKKYKCKQQLIEFVKNHPQLKKQLRK